jgi:hypothetical protein
MRIDIDRLTEAELVDLNHRVVARQRLRYQARAHTANEQVTTDAMVRAWRRSPAPGPLRGHDSPISGRSRHDICRRQLYCHCFTLSIGATTQAPRKRWSAAADAARWMRIAFVVRLDPVAIIVARTWESQHYLVTGAMFSPIRC